MAIGSVPQTPAPAAEAPAGRTLADRLLGLTGGAMIVAAVVLLFVGGPEDGAAVATEGPVLEMVQPRHGGELRAERLHVVFRSERPLSPMAGGWGVDSLHLHLDLNGVELMPAAADIERLEGGLYRWTLPLPQPGVHTLRLLWSGPDHRPLQGGGSRAVQVLVKE